MVQKKLPLINSAHDSETRNIINELIKLFNAMGYTYDEALQMSRNILKEAQKTNNMNKDVQRQLNNIILENGNSEAEVVQARGEYSVLNERMKKTDNELLSHAKNKPTTIPKNAKKPIVSFVDDDGYIDVYTRLYPLFKSKGIPLSCSLITSYLGEEPGRYMSKTQIRELIGEGWEMLGHTHNAHSPNMKKLTEDELLEDVKECRRQLDLLGSNSRAFAYPQGATDNTIMRTLQSYFDFSFSTVNGVNRRSDLDIMQIGRTSFGWNSTNTLDDLKQQVDDVYDNGGWLVVMLHSAMTTADQLNDLGLLIDYIKSKNIEVVNASDGYERYGSKLYVGNIGDRHLNITDNGIYGNFDFKLQNYHPFKRTSWNGKTPSDGISTFDDDDISVTQISSTHAITNNFPDNKGGILYTYKLDKAIPGYNKQEYHIYNSTSVYVRYALTSETWSAWKKIAEETIVKDLKGFIPYADMIFNVIEARSTVTKSHTVAGAKLGDKVAINPNTLLAEGLVYNAWISADDTLTIRLANITDTNKSAANSWGYTVFK